VGFVKQAVHCAGTAIVTFAANRIVPRDMKLGPREEEDARTGMYYEWLGELASFPAGSFQRLSFSLQTVCTAVKFHTLVRKQKQRSRSSSAKRPVSVNS
jgi:hypothetical protein